MDAVDETLRGIHATVMHGLNDRIDKATTLASALLIDTAPQSTAAPIIHAPPGGLHLPLPPTQLPPPACPTGTHATAEFQPDGSVVQACVTDTPITEGVPLPPVVPVPPPTVTPPAPTPTLTPCMTEPIPAANSCTIARCRTDCQAAGGEFKKDDITGAWMCHWPNGNVTSCGGADDASRVCFNSYGDCLNWVQYAGVYGWELFQPDPENPDHFGVRNTNTGEEIFCEGQGKACRTQWPKRGPCPKPPDAPAASWIVFREDDKATWVDKFGNVYGPLCDVSGCPPMFDFIGYYKFDTIWIEFQDGRTGWASGDNGSVVKLCPLPPDDITEPTLADSTEWIDQQDEPDDWSVEFDTDTGEYVLVNDVTGETQAIAGQTVQDEPATADEEVPPNEETKEPALHFESDEYLFAGR